MRISSVNIPDNKRLEIALTYLYGIGKSSAIKILNNAKISADKRAKELTTDEETRLRNFIEKYRIESDLRRDVQGNIKRLKDVKTYRGVRHIRNLPVKGQRTKTNSRTVRGNKRVTMTSGRRKESKT